MKSYVLLAAALLAAACGNEESPAADVEVEILDVPQEPTVTLTPKEPGVDFPDAAIEEWTYEGGQFDYGLAEGAYELGVQSPEAGTTMCANSAKGQHIHLIVDNEPYNAYYEANFQHELEEGSHYILTFLSRSYHESIKTDAAHRAVYVDVDDGSFKRSAPIEEPMLFYSRPKGTYVGADAESILLDFYPVNVELGDEYMVKVEIGRQDPPEDDPQADDVLPPAETFMIDTWQPYLLRGLPMGENHVTLTLVDAEGNRVEAPLNPVRRTFTLEPDPAADL